MRAIHVHEFGLHCDDGEIPFELVNIFVNQEQKEITLLFNSKGGEEYTFELYDMMSRLLISEKNISDSGLNTVKLNIDNISTGIYLSVFKNGVKVFTKKVNIL